MAIKYTQIINSFVSTEGSNGFMTNYVYYSVLVVDTNGSASIVEGKLNQISYLLPYVRTPVDDLMELRETVKGLRSDISSIVDEKMKHVVDSLFPIPDILNKNETEAFDALKEAGLIPVPVIRYPESTPRNGFVQSFSRNAENFKKVDVRIIHRVPEVKGLKIEEASAELDKAGFTANITHRVVSGAENGIVLSCARADESSLTVNLEVSSSIPETLGMPAEEAARILKEQGYEVLTRNQVDGGTPGNVVKWESISEKKIMLSVSIPEKYESRFVNVQWTTMQDSAQDTYGAIAEFNNRRQELVIRMSFTIGAKAKHQICGISADKGITSLWPRVDTETMEPNTKGSMKITLPFGKPFEELPANLSFTLDTQYGLMKKRDPITLKFAFEW